MGSPGQPPNGIQRKTSITQKGSVQMEAICSVVVMAAISLASPPMARAMTYEVAAVGKAMKITAAARGKSDRPGWAHDP